MGKSKKKGKKANVDPEHLEIGDVVTIEWYDVHAYERIESVKSISLKKLREPIVWARSTH